MMKTKQSEFVRKGLYLFFAVCIIGVAIGLIRRGVTSKKNLSGYFLTTSASDNPIGYYNQDSITSTFDIQDIVGQYLHASGVPVSLEIQSITEDKGIREISYSYHGKWTSDSETGLYFPDNNSIEIKDYKNKKNSKSKIYQINFNNATIEILDIQSRKIMFIKS